MFQSRFLSICAMMVLGVASTAALPAFVSFAAEEPAAAMKKAETKPRRQPRGRLPNFYNQVVSEEQREEIYAIQQEYEGKLDELVQQIIAIKAERDAKVEQTLTPEQKKKVADLRAEAKKRREARRASPANSADAK